MIQYPGKVLCGFFQVTIVHVKVNLPRTVWLALQDHKILERFFHRFPGFQADGFGNVASLVGSIARHLGFQRSVLDCGGVLLEISL